MMPPAQAKGGSTTRLSGFGTHLSFMWMHGFGFSVPLFLLSLLLFFFPETSEFLKQNLKRISLEQTKTMRAYPKVC
jgi:hypothetical protein